MSMLLSMLMIYFGLVMLWAAPRLYRLLRSQLCACRCAAPPQRAVTLTRAMLTCCKAASD